jgi:poly-gamma-glutamate capsule biosynthesis protein CapA/YwtB (metallophosphatase superfamily)
LPVGTHKGKAIFYGLGNLSFDTGHGGRKHGDWLGMLVRTAVGRNGIEEVGFRFVRHTEGNETYWAELDKETGELAELAKRSVAFGAKLVRDGHDVRVGAASGLA